MVKVIVGGEVLVYEDLSEALGTVMFWSEATMIDIEEKIVYCYDEDGSLAHQENL